ncbi:glucan endo-1,3-beta-glucosidase 3-like [Olea europaea subsp. europaea]|nr:glucan endo-1,3-beta-glucosidase 3-like [Olea europaea subsp. europaea]
MMHRGLLYKAIRHDFTDAPATFPTTPVTNPVTTPVTNPVTTPAVNAPPANPAPDIVTVPPANPITVTPSPPFTNAVPVPVSNTGPVNGGIPVTNPVTTPSTNAGGQPVSNPVTTYPTPTGGIPVTNPVAPPTTTSPITSTPAVPGQSWCIAKNGVPETTLQSALDYACGLGGADCSAIQQGANCYNPNSLQYHASFAFNSYYQKNPVQTSCDFGGAAVTTNVNPSTGSCIFPTSSSSTSSSSSTTSPITATPMPTTATSSGAAPGSISPSILNNSNPGYGGTTAGFGESPSSANASISTSSSLQPFIGCIISVTSIITGRFVFNI